jgi:hypothetical protein
MRFVQLFIFIILKFSFISFSHLIFGLPANVIDVGFHSYNYLNILSSVIRCTWLNQILLWVLMWLIIFLYLISLFNSFVLILREVTEFSIQCTWHRHIAANIPEEDSSSAFLWNKKTRSKS